MSEQKPTFRIEITTNNPGNQISFRENNGPREGCLMSDLPAPLLHLLNALDEGKRLEIVLAVAFDGVKVMLGDVVSD